MAPSLDCTFFTLACSIAMTFVQIVRVSGYNGQIVTTEYSVLPGGKFAGLTELLMMEKTKMAATAAAMR